MSKIKILDTNKNLYDSAKAMYAAVTEMQTNAERQIKEVREVEAKVQTIEKSNQVKEEQRRKREEEERRQQELQRQQEQAAAAAAAIQERAAAARQETAMQPAAEKAARKSESAEPKVNKPEEPKVDKKVSQQAPAGEKAAQKKEAPAANQKKAAEPKTREAAPKPAAAKKQTAAKSAPAAKQQGAAPRQGSSAPAPARRRKEDNDRKKKKPVIKERVFSVDDEEARRGSRRRPVKKAPKRRPAEPVRIDHAVITEETVSVKLLSEKIGKPVAEILKKLLMLGMMSTINSQIDFDTAQLIAGEFGVELEQKVAKTAEEILVEETEDTAEQLRKRPPVVTIMGHVDHGKTSLLDKIRSSRVTESEAGGITQHIGAYQVELNDERITFIDTPGHEAFTAMRARGAQVTDIVVIVVAADDGIMPQTVEAVNHAKAADVPIIVAINKIDRENANVQKIMQELTEYELLPEEWGGDTVVVPVSAKTGEGIDKLLEMILLVADMQELRANPDRLARGTIVEAQLDKGRGAVATVLVQNGTLKTGDMIIAGTAYGKVRAMVDDRGRTVKAALPSQPVEVIGFSEVPVAGDILHATDGALSRRVAEERKANQKAEMLKKVTQVSLDDLFTQIAEGQIKELNLVVKADVQGSVEAVRQSLEKLSNDEVHVRTIHTGVGAITETDVMLASAANAIIIGFNVRPDNMAVQAAEREKVDVRLYRVIYKAIEDIEKAMTGLLDPEYEEVVTGHAEVRQIFKVSSIGTIAGSYVLDGVIRRNSQIRLLRDNVVIMDGQLSSLKRFKDDAREVAQGYECGLTIENYNDIKEGDIVECFEMQQIAR
ncbi:MAG: translation initiation factor IF-2 [Clostridia bacterium]|nr:translation initiation factor IF-2 [Clostridia bacterium]